MVERQIPADEEPIATFCRALLTRYGDDALSVAERQMNLADTLNAATWAAIVQALRDRTFE